MNIHLIRTPEYSREKYWDVLELLQHYPGPLRFLTQEEPVEFPDDEIENEKIDPEDFTKMLDMTMPEVEAPKRMARKPFTVSIPSFIKKTKWVDLFSKCNDFRNQFDLGDSEGVVILTELDNEKNWFSAFDPSGRRNYFVQTSYWDYFMGSDQRFPVAYLVATEIMQAELFGGYQDLLKYVHKKPRGCVMDMCKNKKEVTLKLRTADFCSDCLDLIGERGMDHGLVQQVFGILEGIRSQMLFKERFRITMKPSRLSIRGRQRKFFLDDLGDLELRLNPMEKTVYLFFLDHPDGIALTDLPDHRAKFLDIYESVSNASSKELIENRVDDLISPLSNSMSEKISRIRRKFNDAVGEEMANAYIIQGPNAGLKRIELDRKLVSSD